MKYLIILSLFTLSSCNVGPRYTPPCMDVPDQWHEDGIVSKSETTYWWESLNDPYLTNYIALTAWHNKEIGMAEASICESRALRKIASSRFLPDIQSNNAYRRNSFSKNGINLGSTTTQPQTALFQFDQEFYNISFDAIWEIDLFGRIRNEVRASSARVESAIERRNDLMITLFGEVGKNYALVRGNQQLIASTNEQIDLLTEKNTLIREQRNAGLTTEEAILTVQEELETLKSTLPPLQQELQIAIYRLSVLTGSLPETLVDELSIVEPLPILPEEIVIGLRSTLLQRRPDIREAERNLAAASADIGVAIAERFPDLRLVGNIAQQSLLTGNLFTKDSRAWTTEIDLFTPVFSGGRLKNNVKAKKAIFLENQYRFESVVLNALEEAESALTAFQKSEKSKRSLQKAYQANVKKLELQKALMDQGVNNRVTLIDAQKNTLALRKKVTQSEMDSLIRLVALYKALGGGWQPCL